MYKILEGYVGLNKKNNLWYIWTNEGAYVIRLSNLEDLSKRFPECYNKQKVKFYLLDDYPIIITKKDDIQWL